MSVEKLALHRQMARVVSAALVSIPPYVLFQAPRFGDEMRDPYTMTARYGLNPLKIIRGNLLDVRPFLELGNIRPLGRIMYSFEFVYAKGLADLLRVPLPLVHAFVRTLALWFAAYCIAGLWRAVETSGHERSPAFPRVVGIMASAGACATIATWSYQPLAFFPVQGLMSLAIVCFAATVSIQLGCRSTRGMLATAVGIGIVAACFYDLTYASVLVVPAAIGGVRFRSRRLDRMQVSWRACLPFLTGFLVVFVPIRLLVQRSCNVQECYAGSEAALTAGTVPAFGARLLSALFPTYWSLNLSNLDVTPGSAALAGIVGVGVGVAAWLAIRLAPSGVSVQRPGQAAIVVLGTLAIAWSATAGMSALSVSQQQIGFQPLAPWRDGIIGYLFLATGCWAFVEMTSRHANPIHFRGALVLLTVLVSLQFQFNANSIAIARAASPTSTYAQADDLVAGHASDGEFCDLANELYDLTLNRETQYFATALLAALRELNPVPGCAGYTHPLDLEQWHRRQLGYFD